MYRIYLKKEKKKEKILYLVDPVNPVKKKENLLYLVNPVKKERRRKIFCILLILSEKLKFLYNQVKVAV